MSEEVKCIKCFQPDMPFCRYYIFTGYDQALEIYHDPIDLTVKTMSSELAWELVDRFDIIMAGGNPDANI